MTAVYGPNTVPRGIPSVTYCRIMGSPTGVGQGKGDVVTDGNSITVIEPGRPSTRHDVAHVLERGLSDEEVCEYTIGSRAGAGIGQSLNPVTAFVADSATAVLVLVGSNETRKWQFLKKTFLPFVANEIFANVAEKDQNLVNTYYKAQIDVSCFEIQDEFVTDLLKPTNRGLSIKLMPETGVEMQGLSRHTITEEMELRRLLADACDNRATHTLPLGGSIDTSSAVFEFRLYQSEGAPNSNSMHPDDARTCWSRLIVLDLPSTNPLVQLDGDATAEGGEVLRPPLESRSLHRSLVAFREVARKLANPRKAALAPFRASLLTHFMSELLGGNALVVAIGAVCAGEPQVTRKTLGLVGALNAAVHFPIGGKEVTDVLQGLLGKYRALVLQTQDELDSREAARLGVLNLEHTAEKQLIEVQRELAQAVLERTEAVEDRARLFEIAELLKAKYNTLMEEKVKQTELLVKAEEERVALGKSLLAEQLKAAETEEEFEKEKYSFNSDLLNANSQIGELELQVDGLKAEAENLQGSVREGAESVEKLRSEIENLHSSIHQKQEVIDHEKEKNIELGAELLTLVNHRDILQKKFDDLQTAFEDAKNKISVEITREKEIEAMLKQYETDMKERDEELLSLRTANAGLDIENQRFKLQMQQVEFEMKKQESLEAELASSFADHPNATDPLGVGSNSNSSSALMSKRQLESLNRKSAKVIRGLEKDLKRFQTDCAELAKEKQTADAELLDLREKYRQKLAEMMIYSEQNGISPHKSMQKVHGHRHHKHYDDDAHRKHPKHGKTVDEGTHEAENDRDFPTVVEHAMDSDAVRFPVGVPAGVRLQEQLIGSYVAREQQMAARLDLSLSQRQGLREAYRELFDKYREVLDAVEEGLPRAAYAHLRPLQEILSTGEKQLLESESFLDKVTADERAALRERQERRAQVGLHEAERVTTILSTYQHTLSQTETELAALRQENIDLHIQIQQLVKSGRPMPEKELNFDRENVHQTVESFDAVTRKAERGQYSEMYEAFSAQVRALQTQLETVTKMQSGGTQTAGFLGRIEDASDLAHTQREGTKQSLISAVENAVKAQSPVPPQGANSRKISRNSNQLEGGSPGLQNRKIAGEVEYSDRVTADMKERDALDQKLKVSAEKERELVGQLEELRIYVRKLESHTAGVALSHRLQEVQLQAADLSSKNMALEEELRSYQQYMRNLVPQYKRQIQQLRKQLLLAQQTAGKRNSRGSSRGSIQDKDAMTNNGEDVLKLPRIGSS